MVERLEWLVEHWETVGAILGLILTLITGKKWLTADRAVAVLTGANEGVATKFIREKVERFAENEGPNVRGLIANHAARTDPSMDKQPSVKESLKQLAPDLARRAVGSLIGRLFRRRPR